MVVRSRLSLHHQIRSGNPAFCSPLTPFASSSRSLSILGTCQCQCSCKESIGVMLVRESVRRAISSRCIDSGKEQRTVGVVGWQLPPVS